MQSRQDGTAFLELKRGERDGEHRGACPNGRVVLSVHNWRTYDFSCVACGWRSPMFVVVNGAIVDVDPPAEAADDV